MASITGFLAEVKSGKFAIYAQWFSLISILVMIIVGFSQLTSSLWCIAAFIFAGTTSLLEITFCMKLLKKDGLAEKAFLFLQKPIARFFYYVVLAVIAFASVNLWVIGLFVTITAVCYLLAFFRKEEPATSSLVGGGGLSNNNAGGLQPI